MLYEVVNALFFTYIATEWLIASDAFEQTHPPWQRVLSSRANRAFIGIVALVNAAARFHFTTSDVASYAGSVLWSLPHVPRAAVAALAFFVALYFDCRRSQPDLGLALFSRKVGVAFLRVAPVYPFLAVLISFVFLFVISLFEKLNLPLELLNMPIYYGTLYGPFSVVYWNVKRRVVEGSDMLPTMRNHYARSA